MIFSKISVVLEDKNGLPICSLVGAEEFCTKSIGNTLTDEALKEMPEDLKKLILAGRIRVNGVYTQYVHENKPELNYCVYCPVNVSFTIADLKKCDFLIDKSFIKNHAKEYKKISNQYHDGEILCRNYVKAREEEENGRCD